MILNPLTGKQVKASGKTALKLLKMHNDKQIKLKTSDVKTMKKVVRGDKPYVVVCVNYKGGEYKMITFQSHQDVREWLEKDLSDSQYDGEESLDQISFPALVELALENGEQDIANQQYGVVSVIQGSIVSN